MRHCGACNNDCRNLTLHPESTNAVAYCEGGACKRICLAGWWDWDNDYDGVGPATGCESPCTYTGPEVCDGLDNDCDGLVDNGLTTPPNFCNQTGACLNSSPQCTTFGPASPLDSGDGASQLSAWAINGATEDNTSRGLLDVTVTSSGTDWVVSLYVDASAPTTLVLQGSISGSAGGVVTLTGQNGSGLGGSVTLAVNPQLDTSIALQVPIKAWVCNYGSEVEVAGLNQVASVETRCDGLDNNCDGMTDETFEPTLGEPCEDSNLGECRGHGEYRCNALGDGLECFITTPGQTPGPETCNGLDDNCNGDIDEGAPDDVVSIITSAGPPAVGYRIYRYEAAHPDATVADGGKMNHRACSKPNVVPWRNVTWVEAEAACQAADPVLHLCTEAEWERACAGASGWSTPTVRPPSTRTRATARTTTTTARRPTRTSSSRPGQPSAVRRNRRPRSA